MSNKTQHGQEQTEKVEGVHKSEAFFKKNGNILLYVLGGVLVIVLGYFGYREFISKPKNNTAAEQMFIPQMNFEKDSFNLALKGNGNLAPGFEIIANEYSSTPSGNLAKFYAGVCCLQLKQYNEALEYFKKFKSNDEIFAARALANMGNCYVELGELENAAKYFEQAAHKKENDMAPRYIMKATAVYEKLGQYDKAIKLYEEIKTKYPASMEASSADKYIERAKLLTSN